MSSQDQKSSKRKLSWLERKMHSSRHRILRRIFHFLHFYVRPLLLALSVLFSVFVFYMVTVDFRLLRSTPKGVQPVIRITILDWLQARALGRSAKASEAENDFATAKISWQTATGNDPGNPEWSRRWLANIMHGKPSWRLGRDTIDYSYHLLRLSPTNRPTSRADFALIANALEHCRLYLGVLKFFQSEEDSVSPEETAPLLRCLFHMGDYKEFRDRWTSLQLQTPRIDWLEDPLMNLYYLGTKAVLENDPSSRDALNEAVAAVSPSSPHYAQAQRIALRATFNTGDIPASRKILEDLRQREESTILDTLLFWELLINKGSPNEAGEIAQDWENSGDPVTEPEALGMLRVLAVAGLAKAVSKTAEKIIDQIGADSPALWFEYGDWLIKQEKWTLLRALAQQSSRVTEFESIAYYWEGLIAWKSRERFDQAQERFLKIADLPPQSLQIRFELARRLLGLDQRETADALMKEADGETIESRSYWKMRMDSARDTEAFSQASEAAYKSDPEFEPHIYNYLVALLQKQREPELTLSLSDKLIQRQSNNVPFLLIRERALRLNEKHEEADALAEKIDAVRADWDQRVKQALSQGNLESFYQVAEAAYKSDPEFEPHIYNYLVALLEEQREPQLAFSLSGKLIQRQPDFVPFQLIRERALRLNEKHEEADALAEKIDAVRAEKIQQVEQAYSQRDWKAFSQAAEAAYKSDSEFYPHIYNYLVSLLQERREPELAFSLSDKLIQQQPDFIHFQLIRSHALLLNGKHEEAEAILKSISLTEEAEGTPMANDYNMALFKLAVGKGQSEEVLRLYKTLNLENYMPETSQWVKETIAKMSKAGGGGGTVIGNSEWNKLKTIAGGKLPRRPMNSKRTKKQFIILDFRIPWRVR